MCPGGVWSCRGLDKGIRWFYTCYKHCPGLLGFGRSLPLPPPFSSALWHKSSHNPFLRQLTAQGPTSTQFCQLHLCPSQRVRHSRNIDGLNPLYGMNGGGGSVGCIRNIKQFWFLVSVLTRGWVFYWLAHKASPSPHISEKCWYNMKIFYDTVLLGISILKDSNENI